MKIAVIGTGYVGLTTGTCLSELGNDVFCVDIVKEKIDLLNTGKIPIYEPGLKELVQKNRREGRLKFTTRIEEAIKTAEIIFICVGTPPRPNGEADLSYVENVARTIAEHMHSYKVIVDKSTVPVQTGEKVAETIMENIPKEVEFDVVSNPEFLREGSAVHDTFNPDRIVIGTCSQKAANIMKELYKPLKAPVIVTDIRSAEIIKHASNSFLATKISFINSVANICERAGADIESVAEGMGYDKRIGKSFLSAGIGYGGFCLSGEEFVYLGNPKPKLVGIKDAFNSISSQNIIGLSFDGKKTALTKVNFISRRRYKGQMVRIQTSMGRKLEVTSDHPMIVEENGKLAVRLAKDLREGDKVPIAMGLPLKRIKELDVLAVLPDNIKSRIKLRPKKGKLSDYKKEISGLIRCEPWRKQDFFRKNYLNYKNYGSVKSKLNGMEMMIFSSRGNATYFPSKMQLNEDFWRLVGYYLAKVHTPGEKCHSGDRSGVVFTFNIDEKEFVSDVCGILDKLGMEYLKTNCSGTSRITVSSDVFANLIQTALGCGKNSYDAKIPNIAFLQDKISRKALLCGLFRGDGSAYIHKNTGAVTLEFCTCSRTLAHGALLLLQSLGIVPGYNVGRMNKSTTNAHIIRVSGKKQVGKLLFFDKSTNSRIKDCLERCRNITPTGYTVKNSIGFLEINKIEKFNDSKDVYSMELNDEPHMFVTSGGLIVHNCFPKDADAFIRISEKLGFDFKILKAVQEVNEHQKKQFIQKVSHALWNLKGKNIAVLGLAFKADTDDMRFAPSIDIIKALQKEGAIIKAYDPEATENAKKTFENIEYAKDAYSAAENADALLIITEWKEFLELDLEKLKKIMRGKIIVDGRNIYKPEEMKKHGFKYLSIGRK